MPFEALRSQLTGGVQTETAEAITGEANLITAYICHSTGGQPVVACKGQA